MHRKEDRRHGDMGCSATWPKTGAQLSNWLKREFKSKISNMKFQVSVLLPSKSLPCLHFRTVLYVPKCLAVEKSGERAEFISQ